MKHLDKIFTVVAVAALIFMIWLLTNHYDHKTRVEEKIIVDSAKIAHEKLKQLNKQIDETQKEQTVLDSLVIVALLYPDDRKRAENRRAIMDSIRAKRIRESAGR